MTDREMIEQWLVVDFRPNDAALRTDDGTCDADSAVGYAYVDSMCGITLNVEAWRKTAEDGLRVVSRPRDTSQRIMLRYGAFAGRRMRLLAPAERAALGLQSVPDWLRCYNQDDTVRRLRALRFLDPVRASGFPDDIKCLLLDDAGTRDREWVWARLVRQDGDSVFVCRLLNEPFQDYGHHVGDMIRVGVLERSDGILPVCMGKATTPGPT